MRPPDASGDGAGIDGAVAVGVMGWVVGAPCRRPVLEGARSEGDEELAHWRGGAIAAGREEPVVAGGDGQARHRVRDAAQQSVGTEGGRTTKTRTTTPRPWITPSPVTVDQAMASGTSVGERDARTVSGLHSV